MTKHWGPLGWMTLHSVSLIYPENPSDADKRIANRFLELFAETISCNSCKNHFRTMLVIYRYIHPDFLRSRQDFAIFAFRAHNTVNKRIDKPIPSTVAACLATLRQATSQTSFAEFRTAYLRYLNQNWKRELSGDSMMAMASVREMEKINSEYWNLREIPIPELNEEDVLMRIEKNDLKLTFTGITTSFKVGFSGGRLRLTKR